MKRGPQAARALRMWFGVVAIAAFVLAAGCKVEQPKSAAVSPEPGFNPAKLAELDQVIAKAIEEHRLPGAVLHVERGTNIYEKAYGNRAVVPGTEPMTADTIFDLASLTKVFATTPSIMLLVEEGKLDLDEPVHRYLPEFTGAGRDAITVRHLMTHTSGLRAGLSLKEAPAGYAAGIQVALSEKPLMPPGREILYSDINFILLSEIVRRVGGQRLDDFAQARFYRPMGMTETKFLPTDNWRDRIAPTEVIDGTPLRGMVHDPTARHMSGVAGHAGLFSTVHDLSIFCRMMLDRGTTPGGRILAPETVAKMTAVQTPPEVDGRRGLGWDIDTGYSRRGNVFPLGSYGHTGFTGTMVWIDPFSRTFVLFLSNRVHPDGHGDIRALERTIATLAAEAVRGFDFRNVAGALAPRPAKTTSTNMVLNGVDVLEKEQFGRLKGLKVGLITNHTGRNRHGEATIELLAHAPGVELKALFSPEHGIRGEEDANVGDSVDSRTGLPVYSLYGVRREPSDEQLRGLDALVFDIQDIGTRFYTYIATLGNCLEAAGRSHLKFFVLDRVNPIGGIRYEGPINEGEGIFTAYHPIPVRHGMTIGELARMINDERNFGASLEVVGLEGWRREMWFDQTGLNWINPSPNMRNLAEATLYPGIGLLETTALSVGRGTDSPFELMGAPYINESELAAALERLELPGVKFTPIRFTPTYSTFKGKECGGVKILVTERERFKPVITGLAIARILSRSYPKEFNLAKLNTHLRNMATIDALKRGDAPGDVELSWQPALKEFQARREKALLYR